MASEFVLFVGWRDTPLHAAAFCGAADVATDILACPGVSPLVTNSNGDTPAETARSKYKETPKSARN